MENLIWKRLDLGRSACGVTCRPAAAPRTRFSPDSAFRLHVSHLVARWAVGVLTPEQHPRWRCERVVEGY